VQIRAQGFMWKRMKYNENYFYSFIHYFLKHQHRSDPLTDFDSRWHKRRRLTQGCAIWAFGGYKN